MVPALELQKGHHQNIAYDTFKTETENHLEKVIFLTWDELTWKDYQIPHDKQCLERQGCFLVLLFYEFTIFEIAI